MGPQQALIHSIACVAATFLRNLSSRHKTNLFRRARLFDGGRVHKCIGNSQTFNRVVVERAEAMVHGMPVLLPV